MLRLFIDFDNTITVGDVGDELFRKFGGEVTEHLDREYREGTISAKECIRRKCAACGLVGRNELNAFIDAKTIDSTFPDFIEFCKTRGLECTVVSDGFDYYIKRIFLRYGLNDLPFFSNALTLEPQGRATRVKLVASFPYDDEECTQCACCKRNVMLTRTGEEDVLVYVGDGYSDRCPVRYADIVFAKPELQVFCQWNNISYFEYRTFGDVQVRIEQLLQGKHIRKRQTAEANRQALLLAG